MPDWIMKLLASTVVLRFSLFVGGGLSILGHVKGLRYLRELSDGELKLVAVGVLVAGAGLALDVARVLWPVLTTRAAEATDWVRLVRRRRDPVSRLTALTTDEFEVLVWAALHKRVRLEGRPADGPFPNLIRNGFVKPERPRDWNGRQILHLNARFDLSPDQLGKLIDKRALKRLSEQVRQPYDGRTYVA